MSKKKGFAAMDKDQNRAISRLGGLTVSKNKEHMQRIGAIGGKNSGIARKRKTTYLISGE